MREGARVTTAWARRFAESLEGIDSPPALHRAIEEAGARIDVGALARTIELRTIHAAMLGALDSAWEVEHQDAIAPATFAAGGGQDNFATKSFAEALKFFREKKVLTKTAFEKLGATAKRQAFTVAGLARKKMVETAHAELLTSLEAGADLREFGKNLRTRFESAGWTQLSPSHVEVVFRNAALGSYGHGRHTHMAQPEVVAARPFWQILGVKDDRARESHKRVAGKVLRSDDSFWARAYPPFGHNCRCRVVSRSQKDIERLSLDVISGSTIRDLPDPGWDSKTPGPARVPRGTVAPAPKPAPAPPPPVPAPPPPAPPAPPAPTRPSGAPAWTQLPATAPVPKSTATRAKAGVHVQQVQARTPDDQKRGDELLRGMTDKRVLAALDKAPLPLLVVEAQNRGNNGTYWLNQGRLFVNSGRQSDTYGRTWEPGKVWSVSSAGKDLKDATQRTFTHELGHHFHVAAEKLTWTNPAGKHVRASDIIDESWRDKRIKARQSLTVYGGRDKYEYFAEAFAAYRYYKAALKKHDPTAYEMVEAVLRAVATGN